MSLYWRQDRGNLPAQAPGVCLRHRWRLHRGGDPSDGADGPQGPQLGPLPHDAQLLDEAVHADRQWIQEAFRRELFPTCLLRPPVLSRHAAGGPLHDGHRQPRVQLQCPRHLRPLPHPVRGHRPGRVR